MPAQSNFHEEYKCAVCLNYIASHSQVEGGAIDCSCKRCGDYRLSANISKLTNSERSLLSHVLRRRQKPGCRPPWIHQLNQADAVLAIDGVPLSLDERLPSPAEQADRFILWLGDNQPSQSESFKICKSEVSAWIGAPITPLKFDKAFDWLLKQIEEKRLWSADPDEALLTMVGWERYEELKCRQATSRRAFMAMKFNDPELARIVNKHFNTAVERAGFHLFHLAKAQPAGQIDDHMRVALRNSRFVIADLTHANQGAYWEAGFAEGLGRPVIYTCKKDRWEAKTDDGTPIVHFDTNHLVTVLWDPQRPDEAANKLTDTIRNCSPPC